MKRILTAIAALLCIASAQAANPATSPAIASMQATFPYAPTPASNTDLTARTEKVVNMSFHSVILPMAEDHARIVVSYTDGQSYLCLPPKSPVSDAAILKVQWGKFKCSKR